MLRKVGIGCALAMIGSLGLGAQDTQMVIASASRAMGAENLTSITYSGTAQNGNFGQSRSIGGLWQSAVAMGRRVGAR